MKNFVLLSLVVVLQVIGNVLLSRGMRQVGGSEAISGSTIVSFGLRTVSNPWVLAGVALLIGFFILYLAALSRLELSFVLPMTAAAYVLTALFAWLILHETISPARWAGTFAVTLGILLVGSSEHRSAKRRGEAQAINLEQGTEPRAAD